MSQNAKPIIAWNNLALAATLTASTEDPYYPVENLADPRPFTPWMGAGSGDQYVEFDLGAPAAATCFGVSGHDLFTQGASIKFQYFDATWQDAVAEFAPADNKTFLKIFASITAQVWRIYIKAGYVAPPQVGVVFIGTYLEFPTWTTGDFDPDKYKAVLKNNKSVAGQFLGRQVQYRDREIKLHFGTLTMTWVTTYLVPAVIGMLEGLVFFAWDITNHAAEVYYMQLDAPGFASPMRGNARSFEMTLRGPVE
jgi:hypothetical protein